MPRSSVFLISILAFFLLPVGSRSAYAVAVREIASVAEADSVARADAKKAFFDTLPEVFITSREPYREVIPAQNLKGEALARLNSHSVADAVRYFSGVQLKDYGGVGGVKTVDLRSMGTNHTGVFYDGIQLGNAQNGQIDLGRYSLDNVDEISLYNGQKSDIFQSAKDYGTAGSIYIRTRHPAFAGEKKWNVNVTMRTGSFGLANPSFRIEHKFSESVSASVNAEYTYATGRYRFRYKKVFSDGTTAWDTTAMRENGDIHAFRAEGGVYGTVPQGHWYTKFYYYDSERGIPGAIVNNVWKTSQRQWDRNFFVQGQTRKEVTPRYSLLVNAKYARDYMRYLNPDTTLMYLDNRFYQDELYISTAHKYELMKGWDINLAADYQWNHLNSSLSNFSRPERNTLLIAAATAVRFGRLKGQASLLGSFVLDKAHIISGNEDLGSRRQSLARFTPAVFLSWKPWDEKDFSLRAFYKRIFRMPTFNDLYYTDVGNADLRPEYATQYNIGAVYTLEPRSALQLLSLTLDAYHNRVSDKIIAVPKGTGQYRWMMMNIGKVRIWGLDFTARSDISLPFDAMLNLRLNYTFTRAMDYSDPEDCLDAAGTYKGQIAYIPRHAGSVTGSLLWRRATLNYSFIYVGERYHNSSNIPVNYEQPWYTHDLSLSWQQPIGKTALRATLEINNLLNQQYEVILNYPMPGRNFKLILQFDI